MNHSGRRVVGDNVTTHTPIIKIPHTAMAIIKTPQQRELSALQKVEKEMQHHIRMERIHHCIMGALGAMAVGAFFLGRCLRR